MFWSSEIETSQQSVIHTSAFRNPKLWSALIPKSIYYKKNDFNILKLPVGKEAHVTFSWCKGIATNSYEHFIIGWSSVIEDVYQHEQQFHIIDDLTVFECA